MLIANVERFGPASRLVFGCGSVGGRVSARTSLRAMAAAFAGGVTTFDVARSYGYGEAERVLGSFIRDKRSRVTLITKAGVRPNHVSPAVKVAKSVARAVFAAVPAARSVARPALGAQRTSGHFEPKELESSLVESLRALGTDHVDAFLLHACTTDVVERDDVLRAMESFVSRGMTQRVGVASGALEGARWVDLSADLTVEVSTSELKHPRLLGRGIDLLLANRPLEGGALLERAKKVCAAMGLSGGAALEAVLHLPLDTGATGVVVSMLSETHAAQAVDCFNSPQLPQQLRNAIGSALQEAT